MIKFKIIILALTASLIVMMGLGFSKGKVGALSWGPTVDIWAMSIAISRNKFDLPGYLGYRDISQALADVLTTTKNDVDVNDQGTMNLVRQPVLVNKALTNATSLSKSDFRPGPKESGGFITTYAEDIGYVDFYSIAFSIFGYNATATHFLYMSILILSISAYVIQFNKNICALLMMCAAVSALFLVSNSDVLSVSVASIASNRFTSTMGLIPFLYLISVIFSRDIIVNRLLLFLQSAILVFAILCRSSAQWMLLNILFIAILLVIVNKFNVRAFFGQLSFKGKFKQQFKQMFLDKTIPNFMLVPMVLLLVFSLGKVYQYVRLDKIYFSEDLLPHHLVWHSAYMGLSLHPEWSKNLPRKELVDLAGDSIPFTISSLMLQERGINPVGGATGNLTRARIHDRTVRKAFFEFALKNPKFILELYFYYKPISIFKWSKDLILKIDYRLWMFFMLVVSICGLISPKRYAINKQNLLKITVGATSFLAISMLPLFWAYPAAHVMSDQLWVLIFIILTVGFFSFNLIANFARGNHHKKTYSRVAWTPLALILLI